MIKEIENDPGVLNQIFRAITAPDVASAKIDSPKKNELSIDSRSNSGVTDREDTSPISTNSNSIFHHDAVEETESVESEDMFKYDY